MRKLFKALLSPRSCKTHLKVFLYCNECEDDTNDGEGHYFAICSLCGIDLDD